MWAGTAALQKIDKTLQTVRNEAVRLNNQLSGLTDSVANNQRRRLAVIERIAQVRLSAIEYGELNESLTIADKQALETLKLREQAVIQVNKNVERLNQVVIDTEQNREKLLTQVNALAQQLVDVEAGVQAKLEKDSDYLAQLDKASLANTISHEAEQKVAQSQADMAEKAKPYLEDPLFQYLWAQKFGTTEYGAGFCTRFIDSWVARLIKYEDARINYWNITEIPKRLEEHADHIADLADAEHSVLQQIEIDALHAAGAEQLGASVEQAREKLDQSDDAIEVCEAELSQAIEKRADFISGEDSYLKKSLATISTALQTNNLAAINRYVLATHSPTDDQLVLELQSIDGQLSDVVDNLADVKRLHSKHASKLTELERVRRNFKNSRYDDVRSGFSNQSLLVDVLNQFVRGVVDGSDVWSVFERNQRYRQTSSSPTFGSGQFENALGAILGEVINQAGRSSSTRRRRRSTRTTWNKPRSRRSSASRSPSKSNGGFRTGGGF